MDAIGIDTFDTGVDVDGTDGDVDVKGKRRIFTFITTLPITMAEAGPMADGGTSARALRPKNLWVAC
eukprot:6150761-Pyramimonas_sp.AAC.1